MISDRDRPVEGRIFVNVEVMNQSSTMETRGARSREDQQDGAHCHQKSKRALEPMETISEIWFGLIMVLTFTCSLSVNGAGREEVRTLLIGALGCNLAWGIIDSVMHLVRCFVERGAAIARLRAVRYGLPR